MLDSQQMFRYRVNKTRIKANFLANASALKYPHQIIVTGCPGSGKSYYVDTLSKSADHVIRTQFHTESSFFDFVGSYKPTPLYEQCDDSKQLEEADGTLSSRGKPLIDYKYVPGPLMEGLYYALSNTDENIVVLIEEINRGNTAAILGDILQLLDRDESGVSRYGIKATPEQIAYFASLSMEIDTIKLPSNLYIWATMNSADQGVFPLDTAFRRRWNFVYKGYTEKCLYSSSNSMIKYGGQSYEWDEFRSKINSKLIELGIHEDKLIGPYFLTESQLSNPEAILDKLFLYLWDDVLRFRQESLFNEVSFSSLADSWLGGSGAPLKIEEPTRSDSGVVSGNNGQNPEEEA